MKDENLQGLAPEAIAALAQQMLQRLRQQDSEIRFKDAKIEQMLAENEAHLQAKLEQARGDASTPPASDGDHNKRKPRRQPLPDRLRREDLRHEPENTNCPDGIAS